MRLVRYALFGAVLGFCLRAGATTFVLMEPAELASISDAIVVGRVASIEAIEAADGSVATYLTVATDEVWQGPVVAGQITIKQPGGFVHGRGRFIFGSPTFRTGERVLLFLSRGSDGTLHASHLAMGKFSLVTDPFTGREAAVRDLSKARVLSPMGTPIPPGPELRPLDEIRSEVREVPGQGDAPRREAAPLVIHPSELGDSTLSRRISQEFNLLGPSRWFEADSAAPVVFLVDQNGDPFFTQAEVEQGLDDSLAAWTDVPSASILLQRGAQTIPSPFGACDDENKIVFEDPFGEIDPPVGCSGTVAIGGFCDDPFDTVVVNGTLFMKITEGDLTFADGWDGCPGRDDLCLTSEVATHEIGHAIGLDHSSEDPFETDPALSDATMYAFVHDDGRCAEVRADDIAALTFIYPGLAGEKLIGARKLLIRDKATDATRRKLVLLSKDALAITAPVDSPIDLGATLAILNPTSLESQTFVLPAGAFDGVSGWRGLGNPPGSKGYKYLDRALVNTACNVVLIKPGRVIRAVCRGDQITCTLDESESAPGANDAQGTLAVRLSVGATDYCMEFPGASGAVKKDRGTADVRSGVGLYKVLDAPAPPLCSGP